MSRARWTPEQIKLLEENYATMSMKELQQLLGKNSGAIHQYAFNYNTQSRRNATKME